MIFLRFLLIITLISTEYQNKHINSNNFCKRKYLVGLKGKTKYFSKGCNLPKNIKKAQIKGHTFKLGAGWLPFNFPINLLTSWDWEWEWKTVLPNVGIGNGNQKQCSQPNLGKNWKKSNKNNLGTGIPAHAWNKLPVPVYELFQTNWPLKLKIDKRERLGW